MDSDSQNFPYLVYVQRFDPVHRGARMVDPSSGLIRLRRAMNARNRTGAVVDVLHARSGVSVLPYFGEKINDAYTCKNSMELSVFFNLNKYADKETFNLLNIP